MTAKKFWGKFWSEDALTIFARVFHEEFLECGKGCADVEDFSKAEHAAGMKLVKAGYLVETYCKHALDVHFITTPKGREALRALLATAPHPKEVVPRPKPNQVRAPKR